MKTQTAIRVNADNTITIVVTPLYAETTRRIRGENGLKEGPRIRESHEGTLTITIKTDGVIRDLKHALYAKTLKAIEMGGNITARATNVMTQELPEQSP